MKSGQSHCTHGLASDVRQVKEEEKKKDEDVMTSKNLTTLTWQVGN